MQNGNQANINANLPLELIGVFALKENVVRFFLKYRLISEKLKKYIEINNKITNGYFDIVVQQAVKNEIRSNKIYRDMNLQWKKEFSPDFYEKIIKLAKELYVPIISPDWPDVLAKQQSDHLSKNNNSQIICERRLFGKGDYITINLFYNNVCPQKRFMEIKIRVPNELQEVFENVLPNTYSNCSYTIVRIVFGKINSETCFNTIYDLIKKNNVTNAIIEDQLGNSLLHYVCICEQFRNQHERYFQLLRTIGNIETLYQDILYSDQCKMLKTSLQQKIATGIGFFKVLSKNFEHINGEIDNKLSLESVLNFLDILFSNNFLNPNLVYHHKKENGQTEKRSVLHSILHSGQMKIVKLWDKYKDSNDDYFLYKKIPRGNSLWQVIFGRFPDDRDISKCITTKYKEQVSKFLLKKGLNPNEETEGKHTPLHLARIYSPKLLEIFLEYSANIFTKNNCDQTPLSHVLKDVYQQKELENHLEVLKKYDYKIIIQDNSLYQKTYQIQKSNNELTLLVDYNKPLYANTIQQRISITCLN